MLTINRQQGKLLRLKTETLSAVGITERSDIQELIFHNSEQFFGQECGEDVFLLGQEISPSKFVKDRIDLLAIDADGRVVIIELKRGGHKLHLLQSLTYAAMVSAELVGKAAFESLVTPSKVENFREFLSANEIDLETINKSQRIILIAEFYDYEVLQTAQWLTDSHGLNITCYELAFAQDISNGSEYLSAVQIYPPKTLAAQARQRGAIRSQEENKFPTLQERIAESTNPFAISFLNAWLATDPRMNKRQDSIVLPKVGKMRFRFTSRRGSVRVAQLGRFSGDLAKWASVTGEAARVRPDGLRFHLDSGESMQAFKLFAQQELDQIIWLKGSEPASDEDQDESD